MSVSESSQMQHSWSSSKGMYMVDAIEPRHGMNTAGEKDWSFWRNKHERNHNKAG